MIGVAATSTWNKIISINSNIKKLAEKVKKELGYRQKSLAKCKKALLEAVMLIGKHLLIEEPLCIQKTKLTKKFPSMKKRK